MHDVPRHASRPTTASNAQHDDGRPRIAVIVTSYFAESHADVVVTRLIEGYPWRGEHIASRIRVVSMYIELPGRTVPTPRPDIGVEIASRNGIPLYDTVAEAIGCGRPGVDVDGVVIIGEHGDYEFNEFGQRLYPRRRLFDSAMSTMIASGRVVPIFTDKHLSWSFRDALAMYTAARRLGIPLLAGSSVPLAWRIPTSARVPAGASIDGAVQIGHGKTDVYGIHIIETLQSATERRAGGETGVAAVRGLRGADAKDAVADGTVDTDLLDAALATLHDLPASERAAARVAVDDVYVIEYTDGLRAAGVNIGGGIKGLAVAVRGPQTAVSYQNWLQPNPHGHFIFLVRQIESLILTGVEPYPVERTLLATGVVDAIMHSLHDGGVWRKTPELEGIAYVPAYEVADTGADEPLPPTAARNG